MGKFSAEKPIPFSVAKIRFTLLWGLLFVLTINIFHRLIMIHNPVKSLGYYCSEIIDTIFADAGIYLSPRSDYDSMTSPSEFIGSPHLRFIGVAKGLPQRQIGADPVFYYTELRLIIRYFNKSGRITCIDNEGRVSLSFQNLGYKTSVFTSDPDAVKKLKESSIEASLSDMCSNPLTHVFIEESVLGNLKNDSQRSRFLEHLKKLLRPEGCIIFCCRIKKLGFALDYALPLWTCNRLIRQSGLAIQYDGVFKPSSVHPYDTYYAVLRRK